MPAAAVIPAPIAYIKVVAVKTLVVGFLFSLRVPPSGRVRVCVSILRPARRRPSLVVVVAPHGYFEKIRVFKAGVRFEYISME